MTGNRDVDTADKVNTALRHNSKFYRYICKLTGVHPNIYTDVTIFTSASDYSPCSTQAVKIFCARLHHSLLHTYCSMPCRDILPAKFTHLKKTFTKQGLLQYC